jgi:uncharacterized protein YsxB (DUF464 family)
MRSISCTAVSVATKTQLLSVTKLHHIHSKLIFSASRMYSRTNYIMIERIAEKQLVFELLTCFLQTLA